MDERGWRVAEQSVDILYTEYSMSKGQSLINGVNILARRIACEETTMTGQLLMQLFLLLATATLVLYFLGNRRKARAKAGVKLGFLLFIAACIWAVLRPDDLTIVANYVGVSRGTDLLLYLLVVAFMFTTLSS